MAMRPIFEDVDLAKYYEPTASEKTRNGEAFAADLHPKKRLTNNKTFYTLPHTLGGRLVTQWNPEGRGPYPLS